MNSLGRFLSVVLITAGIVSPAYYAWKILSVPSNLGGKLRHQGLSVLSFDGLEDDSTWGELVSLLTNDNEVPRKLRIALDTSRSRNVEILKACCRDLYYTDMNQEDIEEKELLMKQWCTGIVKLANKDQ